MVSVCLPSAALLQHLPSYLGFSYLGRGVSFHSCSSKAQPLLLTSGLVVKNLPSNSGGMSSISGWRTKIPHATGHLSSCTTHKALVLRQDKPVCGSYSSPCPPPQRPSTAKIEKKKKKGCLSIFISESESRSVVSSFLQPHELYSPLNSPHQNTGVGSLSLLRGSSQPRVEHRSPALQVDSLPAETQGKAIYISEIVCSLLFH